LNGLQLSKKYFVEVAQPRLKSDFPELYPRLAAGLVGNGSECFGYDDELSRDHDWGVDFYIWTAERDRGAIQALRDWKDSLFAAAPPEFARTRSEYGARIGVMTCCDFYKGLIGAGIGPHSIKEWLSAPEENLAIAVNGEVFIDGTGEFTGTREYLLAHYPEVLRKKRIATCCMALAQAGQYNLERIAKRGDTVTLRYVLSHFSENVIAIVFLLNKIYRPFYKWAFRRMLELPVLGNESGKLLLKLAEIGGFGRESLARQMDCISEICALITAELRSQQLAESDDWFLATHGEIIRAGIENEFLRSLPAQYKI